MLPRARPVYPGPLTMTPEEHYEYVESQARITSGGNRIVCENEITINVDFGTEFEERHSEDCVCAVCKDVEKVKMGRQTVITGGCGVVFKEGESEEGCDDQKDGSSLRGDYSDPGDDGVVINKQADTDDDPDSEHDGQVIFAGSGKMTPAKITKPQTPAKLRKAKGNGASTSTVHTDGLSSHNHSHSTLSQHKLRSERDLSEMSDSGASGSNASGVAISYSHSPSHSLSLYPGSAAHLHDERGRSASKDLHANWDPLIKNKEGLASKGLGAMKRSLSKRSISIGKGKSRGKGSDGSASSRTGKVWNFARSLSRRSNNSSHSSQMQKEAKEEQARLEKRMDASEEIDDYHSSFEEQDSVLHTSFQGDDMMEHGAEGTPGAFIGPRRSPEIHNFPAFDPGRFVPNTPATWNGFKRRSGSESNISALDLNQRSGSRSPSLRSRHYSSRGSFSLNWHNISSDTVYHKHARRFYQNPASYGPEVSGYNLGSDNPYLAYDRYKEVSEWTDGTEEVDPGHVVALTTRELKRLYGEPVKINFDFIPEGYVNPPNSRASSVDGDDDDDDDDDTIMGDELEKDPEPRHKNLINLLGMPGWDRSWEEMTKMQRHFHIVAAGDWKLGPVFDVKSNYSDYYGVALFDPDSMGCYGVNRKDVRGLDVPDLQTMQLKFPMKASGIDNAGGYGETEQAEHTDENVEQDSPAEYDSDGFLYEDDKRLSIEEAFGPPGITEAEAERIYSRTSVGGEGSGAGEYAGSIVEGFGTTDDHHMGTGGFNESFQARIARGDYTATGRFDQNLFTPSNPGSIISEDYDTVDESSDDGVSRDYSFGNSSFHGTECQDDWVIGTSKFAPHAFQLYPPYEAANDVTTIGATPDEVEKSRPVPWDAEFMEDIMGYSVQDSHKPRDPTAEMVLMSYLDPVARDGSKTRSRSSTGSLTPTTSPTKSTKSIKPSFIPNFKSLPRVFNKDRSLPPAPILGAGTNTITTNRTRNIPSLRKASLSTANVAKIPGKPTSSSKGKQKSKGSKASKGKGKKKSKISPPSDHSSDSNSNTSYVDLTRPGSQFFVPPSQSLILYLYGHGLSVSHIALLLQPLSQTFLYDSPSSWRPTGVPNQHVRLPPHHLFTPTTFQTINQYCSATREWWEVPNAVDAWGKKLPEAWKLLKRESYLKKSETMIRKVVENFVYWRLRGEVPHGNLMKA